MDCAKGLSQSNSGHLRHVEDVTKAWFVTAGQQRPLRDMEMFRGLSPSALEPGWRAGGVTWRRLQGELRAPARA